MAVTSSIAANPLITTSVLDAASNATIETAATASQKLYYVEVTNPNSEAVFTKIFNAASNSTSTTQHYMQLYCPGNTTCYMYVPRSITIANGIQFYTTISRGTGAAQTSPTSSVIVRIGTTAA